MALQIASKLHHEPLQNAFQVSHVIRPRSQRVERMGLVFLPGQLQQHDVQIALTMMAHRIYIRHAVRLHGEVLTLRLYQIQKPEGNGLRIFGTLAVDEDGRYLMNCVETDIARYIPKNKEVMAAARASLCH